MAREDRFSLLIVEVAEGEAETPVLERANLPRCPQCGAYVNQYALVLEGLSLGDWFLFDAFRCDVLHSAL